VKASPVLVCGDLWRLCLSVACLLCLSVSLSVNACYCPVLVLCLSCAYLCYSCLCLRVFVLVVCYCLLTVCACLMLVCACLFLSVLVCACLVLSVLIRD
jgi:hypothetical protein